MSNLYWLSDAQMERLKPFFPKSHGKPRVDDRRVLSGKTIMIDATYLKAHRTASSLCVKKGRAHARSGGQKAA